MYLMRELVDEKYRKYVDYLNDFYDYCYLESMHYINQNRNIAAIITGLSYGLVGIEAKRMDNTLNFCMHSQDLYYDYLHAKYAVLNGKGNIRKCYITLAYYSFFYDLSLCRNKGRCSYIYEPLFQDCHHAERMIFEDRDLIGEDEICKRFIHEFFLGDISYYGVALDREMISELYLTYRKSWQELTQKERDETASEAAIKHNRHIMHKETFKENVQIIEDYIKFLVQRNVRPIVLVMPFSEEYRKSVLKEYKEILLHVLEVLPYQIDFLDLNDLDVFEREDFLDATHLNADGAVKATDLIYEIFGGLS